MRPGFYCSREECTLLELMNAGKNRSCPKLVQDSHLTLLFASRLMEWQDALPWLQWAAMEGTPYGSAIRGQFSPCIEMRETPSTLIRQMASLLADKRHQPWRGRKRTRKRAFQRRRRRRYTSTQSLSLQGGPLRHVPCRVVYVQICHVSYSGMHISSAASQKV